MGGLPKFEEFKAPWELDAAGLEIAEDDQKVDPKRIKRHLYNVLSDKERLQESVKILEADKAAVQKKLDEAARKDETETDALKRQVEELTKKAAAGEQQTVENLKLAVALDKGLTSIQAKRLVGATREELEKDADDLVASFGGGGQNPDASEDGPKRAPRKLHTHSTDPGDKNDPLGEYSPEKLAKLVPM